MVGRSALVLVTLIGAALLVTGLLLTETAKAGQDGQSCVVPGEYGTIQAAVDDARCSLIEVGSGTFGENVVISRTVRIEGRGRSETIVDGGGSGDVFHVQFSNGLSQPLTMTVRISDLSLVNGELGLRNEVWSGLEVPEPDHANLQVNVHNCAVGDNASGGVLNRAHAGGRTIVAISASSVSGNEGGGIYNDPFDFGRGELKVVESSVSDNSGVGIVSAGCMRHFCSASLEMTGSTISGNAGSGLVNDIAAEANVRNSTISGNVGEWVAGIISCGNTVLNNSTVSGNSAGIVILGTDNPYGCRGTVDATHSLVANSERYADCILEGDEGTWPGYFGDYGYNIIEDGSCIYAASSRAGDPLLEPLAHNGGKTLTHGLLAGSMAIDAGYKAGCAEKDQRGYSRPADGDGDGTAVCDIGAFELRHFSDSFYFPAIMSDA